MTSCRPVNVESSSSSASMANVNSQNSANKLPRDAQVIVNMFSEAGIKEYDPRCVQQMLEFMNNYTTAVLEDARVYANYAKKKNVDIEDIKLAISNITSNSFAKPPPRETLLHLASERNIIPLPAVKPHCGIRLPPERYCLHQADYALASKQKNKTVSSASQGAGTQSKPPLTKAAMKNVTQSRLGGMTAQPLNVGPPGGAMQQGPSTPGGVVIHAGGNKFVQPNSIKEEPLKAQSMDTL